MYILRGNKRKEGNIMNEDTKKLLEECNYGCKMAVESMEQILEYVDDEELEKLIICYMEKHIKIEEKSSVLLEEAEQGEKSPGIVASTFAWLTVEMKLMMKDDNHQVTKILMNGCNMGIQSVSKSINDYHEANGESKQIAKELVDIEEDFMKKLKEYL